MEKPGPDAAWSRWYDQHYTPAATCLDDALGRFEAALGQHFPGRHLDAFLAGCHDLMATGHEDRGETGELPDS
ncbi:MAG: hypothetical protein ACRCY9_07565 [Phycicoccus sp.]